MPDGVSFDLVLDTINTLLAWALWFLIGRATYHVILKTVGIYAGYLEQQMYMSEKHRLAFMELSTAIKDVAQSLRDGQTGNH